MFMAAARLPAALGLKLTFTKQLAPAAMLLLQSLVWEKSLALAPLKVMEEISSDAFPELRMERIWGVPVVPTLYWPKFRAVVERLASAPVTPSGERSAPLPMQQTSPRQQIRTINKITIEETGRREMRRLAGKLSKRIRKGIHGLLGLNLALPLQGVRGLRRIRLTEGGTVHDKEDRYWIGPLSGWEFVRLGKARKREGKPTGARMALAI